MGPTDISPQHASEGDAPLKRRYPGIAALMSLAVPGLGQLYNAQPVKAVLFMLLPLVVLFVVPFTGIQFTFNGIAALLFFFVVYRLAITAEALLTAWRLGEVRMGRFNSLTAYAVFGFVAMFIGMGVSPQTSGKAFGVYGYVVKSEAMAPTLHAEDQIMADVRPETLVAPMYGDILFITDPTHKKRVIVRRVVGLGGDRVALRDGVAVRNGEPLVEGYIPNPTKVDAPEVRVPSGAVYVLSDNRTQGPDSRDFGPVPLSALLGRAMFVYGAPDMERVGLELRLDYREYD